MSTSGRLRWIEKIQKFNDKRVECCSLNLARIPGGATGGNGGNLVGSLFSQSNDNNQRDEPKKKKQTYFRGKKGHGDY